MAQANQLFLLDNTVLSNFTVVERPEFVQMALGEGANTVEAVWKELLAGIENGSLPPVDWSWLPKLTLSEEENTLCLSLQKRLNKGEAACLAVAANRGGKVFTDDWDARQIALEMQIPVSGTLGILMRLVDGHYLSIEGGDEMLALMIEQGYFSPVRSLRELL